MTLIRYDVCFVGHSKSSKVTISRSGFPKHPTPTVTMHRSLHPKFQNFVPQSTPVPCSLNRKPQKWTEWRRQFPFFNSWRWTSVCNFWVLSFTVSLHSDVNIPLFKILVSLGPDYLQPGNLAIAGLPFPRMMKAWVNHVKKIVHGYWLASYLCKWLDTLR